MLDRHTLFVQQRGAGVSEIVESDASHACPVTEGGEVPVDVARFDWCADFCGEDQAVVVPRLAGRLLRLLVLLRSMLLEGGAAGVRDGNGPLGPIRLHPPELEFSVGAVEGLADTDDAAHQVDVVLSQSEGFPAPQA
ncbi:hypothetical protein [Actinopolymorpha sp. B9G3]|uniref:hypothetical protein n=1 Tax=Actinopolymorpha sp. B9G3 TaxID=3158970 RepID=UPI0032D97663